MRVENEGQNFVATYEESNICGGEDGPQLWYILSELRIRYAVAHNMHVKTTKCGRKWDEQRYAVTDEKQIRDSQILNLIPILVV